ncbi:MAG: hypothetical protein RLZZ387_137, partial [Chloroflexota bacterium]
MEELLTLLVVDDDVIDRTAVRRTLQAAGMMMRLEEAEDSASALDILVRGGIDCVLLDYQLPDSDGLSVINAMRARGITTPVIALTGHGDEELVVALMKAGAADYLTKGTPSFDRLAQSVRNAVRVYRAEEQARQAERALRASVDRLRFLAEASRLLSSALDAPAVLNDLARLLVSSGADWCAVDLIQGDEPARRIASAFREGLSSAAIDPVMRLFTLDVAPPVSPLAAIRTARPQIFPPPPGVERVVDQGCPAQFAAAGVAAALSVPMMA